MAAPGTKRRSTRQAASRKRSIYVDPETDDEFEAESEEEFRPVEPPAPPPKKRKVARTTRHKPQTRSDAAKSKQTVKSMFRVGKPRKPNSKTTTEKRQDFSGPTDNLIPQWTSLPVNILRDVFVFASQPIHEQTTEASANVAWLLRAARTCRAFALPALEAYYQSPSMLSNLQPHHFLDLLCMPSNKRYIDYNVKVQSLYIDVARLAYVAHNRPPFDLRALVAKLPQLQHMEIIHPKDKPPYRPMKIQRWVFQPRQLVDTLDTHRIRLRSWRWTREMIHLPSNDVVDLYGMMATVHQSNVFSRLERLVVCGFNYEDSSEPVAELNPQLPETEPPPGLATSISKLSSLKDLTFMTCDIVMDKFLQRLPTNLRRLELSNCLEITSDMMREYFKTSGAELRELVLNHNAALSLSFLTGLKELCPRLEALKVDMHYYSERFTINDAEPLYNELLTVDETPSWPPHLRRLELVHASKWSPEAAQNLFRSLIDSAPQMQDLRHLVVHAHINIPWRDRVGFRDQWIERLRRVYLRRIEDPAQNMGSLRQYRLWKQAHGSGTVALDDEDELGDNSDEQTVAKRQLSHVRVSPHKPSGDTDVFSDSDDAPVPRQRPRRSKRVAETHVVQVSKSTTPTPDSDSTDENEAEDWRKQPEKFIQGLCDVVDVRIDNQRPRENQWTEGDFLDSEVSGDEDWHSGAESEAEESYAW
ncbi:Hypothetical predicted protein [Lecanosticta acicola]|uniref:Uncharacterized protein n=1 Tax=Lecanosticta acicola TaxID=111012 RepID=A0AAI9EE04_9PEZI|nr:Hypothetical predicted protein [Lecanosticta acicola]